MKNKKKKDGLGKPIIDDIWYLVQDTRQYVGNDVLWWALPSGYTCDLNKAERFRGEDCKKRLCRDSDVPWPLFYILEYSTLVVDFQHIQRYKKYKI